METSKFFAFFVLLRSISADEIAVTNSSKTDSGSCNTTSYGNIFSDGHYAPMILQTVQLPVDAPFYCFYKFIGTKQQRIKIDLRKLSVGRYDFETRSCLDGQLRIYDGSSEPGNYRYPPNTFCGNLTVGDADVFVFTSGHLAVVELISQTPRSTSSAVLTFKYVNIDKELEGFPKQISHSMKQVQRTAYICTWRVTVEDCSSAGCPLLSPGYPGIYPPNIECVYHVISRETNAALQIKFSGSFRKKPREFNIKTSGTDCRDDYLEIYDGNSTESPKIGRFCGNHVPDITTSGNQMYILFASGLDSPPYASSGFHATVMMLTNEWSGGGVKVAHRLCDWMYNVSESSISTPDHWLPRNAKCTYTIHIADGHRLDAVFHFYSLGSHSCDDRVDVYENGRHVRRVCESTDQENARFHQHQQHSIDAGHYSFKHSPVVFEYYTEEGHMQSSPNKGFWLSFRQVLERSEAKATAIWHPSTKPVYRRNNQRLVDYHQSSVAGKFVGSGHQSIKLILCYCVLLCLHISSSSNIYRH